MPAHQRQQPIQTPASAPAKTSSKYTNKDGSKFITIPKSAVVVSSPEPSPAMPPSTTKQNGQTPIPSAETTSGVQSTVNKKKQKRREKERAKQLAALQSANAQSAGSNPTPDASRQVDELQERFQNHGLQDSHERLLRFDSVEGDAYDTDEADEYVAAYEQPHSPPNGYPAPPLPQTSKKSKKKKKGGNNQQENLAQTNNFPNGVSHNHVSLPVPPPAPTTVPRGQGISKEKIWNTSSQEERERIKEFWLSLGEDERKSLVKVEKDAVLKKMKEQQKHSCSCTVCGRKRTAIEEELEVLYDAYYEELEQYANHQGENGIPPMMPPPRRFGALSGLQPPHRLPAAFNSQQPSRGRIVEQLGDEDDEEDDEYSEQEGDEDDYSDEDEPEELPRTHASDFFNFGNSLTVQGGILTVADDLLKNDGKKFIEMMEQLAERRMAREEDARDQYNPSYGHPPNGAMHSHSHNHNHPPPVEDDEYDDEEDDEEYESGEEDDYDEDEEMDTMTEEQRMEEGRRMFQIFAARMFEQRVLTAYKEKIAKERQQKLLEELEEETRADSQKKAKKAKDAQKKKEKMAQKKQALAEERAKREADKAAEEAALRAAEQKKAEEQRQKAEEKRKKKEAQKRAEEEERQRKEAEKQKRIQEQRDRQAELERKQREVKDKERKEKEELRLREKEAKEAKEREAREKKEKLEREKRDKELQAKVQKDAREAKDKLAREELAAQQKAAAQAAHVATQAANVATQAAKRVQQPPVSIPANLQSHPVASPHVAVVTPAIPKAPTPIKLRTTSSQQDSNASIPTTPQTAALSQSVSPLPSTSSQGSPGPVGPPGKPQSQPFLHQPQATSPIHSALKSPPGISPSPFAGLPHVGFGGQPNGPPPIGGFGRLPPEPMFPMMQPGRFGPVPLPNGMPFQPMHPQMPPGRGFPIPQPPPGFAHPMPGNPGVFGGPKENGPIQSHSRQQSGSFDKPHDNQTAQPIARPAPIGRPRSIVHGQRQSNSGTPDVDDLSLHLGSSALLDDSDEPFASVPGARRSSVAPGSVGRQGFPQPPFPMDPVGFGSPMMYGNTWGNSPNVFAGPPMPSSGSNFWPPSAGFGGPMAIGAQPSRPSQSQPVVIRLKTVQACKSLKGSAPEDWVDISTVKQQIDLLHPHEQPVSEDEILDICETEGNSINGGGSFDIRKEADGPRLIRYQEDIQAVPRPGEIGSPVIGSVGTVGMHRYQGPPPGF